MKKKSIFKIPKKKKEDFRAKNSAYLQAKAAYQPCLFDSDKEEENSNSDNMKGVRSGSHYYLMQPIYSFWFIGNKFGFGYSTRYCH
jgi:hypothetical protein